MKSKVVAILETRTGARLAELIARRGALPMLAPALEEVPDVDPLAVDAMLVQWRVDPFKVVIFQTGVGTRALFQATDVAGSTAEVLQLLHTSLVIVRGPKPVGELNARQVRIDIRAASPFTTDTVLQALEPISLIDAPVLVQRYGAENQKLREALIARGGSVREIATYRWALPSNIQPLVELLDALRALRVDAVVFTSAVQIHNLHALAQQRGCSEELVRQLNRLVIASIGPVCSRALREHGVIPTFEADPPKLGPLVNALEAALSVSR
ncbi:MAG: uroporphyrinogen-III synthase [Pseudomonadota bacterium]|nr:uroporphyrinogen-III synthase [Pseudomonadota bacterium]